MATPNFALNDVDMFAPVLHLKNKRDYSRYLAEGRKKCFFSCLRFPVRPGGFYEIAKSNWQVSSCSAKKTLVSNSVSLKTRWEMRITSRPRHLQSFQSNPQEKKL